jgi:hypothetical protein
MRKFLISILLAGVAVSPALAQDRGDRSDRGERSEEQRSERQQVRQERQQARDQSRQARSAERPQFQVRERQLEVRQQRQLEARERPAETSDRGNFERRQRGDGVSRWTRDRVQQSGETSRWTRDPNQRAGETSRWTRDRVAGPAAGGDFRQGDRAVPNVMRSPNPLAVDNARRRDVQSHYRDRNRWTNGGWDRNWRNDRRYDWRSYRDRHRSVFRLSVYLDPFGYRYRPYNVGYRLVPAYYSQRYWFDPGMYGLPYPPPGTQWVRYWDDALLVDVYTGEVVDVIQNFFW